MGQLSPNAMNVQGTGQTVGDLKGLGYSQGDINTLGGGTPNIWQKLVKGGAMGTAQGLQNIGQQPMQGGGPAIQNMPVAPVDPSYFQPQMRSRNNLNFYGQANG